MTHWLFPANTKFYDVFGAMKEMETYWPQNARVSVGDHIYLYLAAPYKQVGFVCEVLETDLSEDDIIEFVRPFFVQNGKGEGKTKPFLKIKPVGEVERSPDSLLGLNMLREHGLNGRLMGPRKLENNPPLLAFIKEHLS